MAIAVCVECGGKVSTEAPSCPHCGCLTAAGMDRCPECNAGVRPNSFRCPKCGVKLRMTPAEEAEAKIASNERAQKQANVVSSTLLFAIALAVIIACFKGCPWTK